MNTSIVFGLLVCVLLGLEQFIRKLAGANPGNEHLAILMLKVR